MDFAFMWMAVPLIVFFAYLFGKMKDIMRI